MNRSRPYASPFRSLALAAAVLGLAAASHGEAERPTLRWQQGPALAPLGSHLAEIDLSSGYVYLDGDGTRRLMDMLENPVNGTEVGVVAPAAEEEGWFVVFEYDATGYVRDTEAGELDSAAMLESIRRGTEQANKERERRGWAPIRISGWHEAPHYDALTNNLTWAIIGESDGVRTVNKIVKLLGRKGVMTATLVSPPEELVAASTRVDLLLAGYRYRPGNTYAEFAPGDRVAQYGLTALVVGGAGAALAKSGLLARFWKVLVAGAAGLLAFGKRLFGSQRAEDAPISQA